MKAALDWLRQRGFRAEKIVRSKGLGGNEAGKPIGMSTEDGKTGFRVEYDDPKTKSGAHINVFSGKEKGPHFKFRGTEKTVIRIVKRFRRR